MENDIKLSEIIHSINKEEKDNLKLVYSEYMKESEKELREELKDIIIPFPT
jgi:hypothetical protein